VVLALAGRGRARAEPSPASQPARQDPATADPDPDPDPDDATHGRPARGLISFPDFTRRGRGSLGAPLKWNPAWPRFGWSGWIVGGSFGALAATMAIVGPVGSDPWIGGEGPDESVRDALRAGSEEGRRTRRDISDVLLTTTVTYSLADALLVAGWYRRSPEVAKQMALIDLEVFAVTQGVIGLVKSLANRERPFGRICGSERPETARDCDSSERFYSFPSGHAGHTFAAAASNCTHHIYLGLYGRRWADALSCVAGFTLAATTGVMRIAGDMHYFSDVMVGAGIGTLVGFGVPWFFHYRHGSPTAPDGEGEAAPTVQLLPYPVGAMAVGTF